MKVLWVTFQSAWKVIGLPVHGDSQSPERGELNWLKILRIQWFRGKKGWI